MHQYSLALESKKIVLFDSHHDDWINPWAFEQMYNEVHKKMSKCRKAEKTDEVHWYNSAGEQVDNKEDAHETCSLWYSPVTGG